MKKQINKILWLSVAVIFCLTACSTPPSKTKDGATYGALGGAAVGALLGQLFGHDSESTVKGAAIGAAIGGMSGAAVGSMMDAQEKELKDALAASEAASVQRDGDLIAITLKGDVTFDTNSAIVKPGLYSEVDRISKILIKYPQTSIIIEGNTDDKGSETYNMELSRKRADSVKNLVIKQGVESSRLQIIPLGESNPRSDNSTEAGRQLNRRVEIKVKPNIMPSETSEVLETPTM